PQSGSGASSAVEAKGSAGKYLVLRLALRRAQVQTLTVVLHVDPPAAVLDDHAELRRADRCRTHALTPLATGVSGRRRERRPLSASPHLSFHLRHGAGRSPCGKSSTRC